MTRLKGNGGCSLRGIRGSSEAALRHLREGTSEMVRVAWTENFIHHPKERWTELQLWFVDAPEKAHEFAAREDPFLVAISEPKNLMTGEPWERGEYVAVCEVKSLGELLEGERPGRVGLRKVGVRTRVLRRLYG